ncbi:MAG TPA: MFS transporter [Candidatus Acidoferrales bacterium]|nr:MFS transporter [Candidatus Acidoferrales bacterium]
MPNATERIQASKGWFSRGVLGIGLASLFSDWGHEAATAILPSFLASLGAPAFALGIIEGVADGLSSFAKLAGGWLADRPQWRKPTGVAGYCATAITTFAYAFAHSWPFILLLRALGWMGRGSRGPSRDSLLADCVAPEQQGRAFGFERAMDTLGAVLGPLSAAALVGVLGLRGVLTWTIVPGLIAAVVFAFLAPHAKVHPGRRPPSFRASLAGLPAGYWRYLTAVFAHGIGDFAPALLILRAAQVMSPRVGAGRAAAISIALYTFHNIISAAASYPAGALSDRIGKRGLLALGYVTAAVAYLGFIFAPLSLPVMIVLFGLAGVHGGFQQPLEKSLAAGLLPAESRGSGFGILATVNGVGDLISSVVVGALWSGVSPAAGFAYAAFFISLGAVLIYKWR